MNTSQEKPIRGMVFGVFDGFHEGHQYFLSQAALQCEELVVVVSLPEMVQILKKRTPLYSYEARVEKIQNFNKDFIIIPSDTKLNEWSMLKKYCPEIVILGYDQHGIARELDKLDIPYTYIEAYYPEKFKSSLMLKNNKAS